MRPSSSISNTLILLASLPFSYAITFDCSHVRLSSQKYDLSSLGGPRSILVRDTLGLPSKSNTTWTLDICSNLSKPKSKPGLPVEDQCPNYTRVCGVTRTWNPFDDPDKERISVERVIPIAGESLSGSGGQLDPVVETLGGSEKGKGDGNGDEGIRLELHGGRFGGRKQMVEFHFICDKKMTGLEGLETEDDKSTLVVRKEGDEKDEDGGRYIQDPSDAALQWKSYGPVAGKEDTDGLRLDWRTKYACQGVADSDEGSGTGTKKSGWGFFTWFILIVFLLIAAYLIFGSWMNYSRYGARGWDLLPHGDTIRDIPYLFKDWSRKVVETVTGGSGRGGYSAV